MLAAKEKDAARTRNAKESVSAEERMRQRKLNSLKAGVHRIVDTKMLVGGVHVIGIGGAGTRVVERFLSEIPEDFLETPGSRFTALAVDIGDDDLGRVKQFAGKFDDNRSQIETISLEKPDQEGLAETLSKYDEFLKLEWPFYISNLDSKLWLNGITVCRDSDGSYSRALAKAAYGRAYYDGERPMQKALKRFAKSVEKTGDMSVVCVVFGVAGGTGSGIAIDLARHLSNGIFGRSILVVGIGILPHQDEVGIELGNIHTALADLDVLCDENKNAGVTVSCGDQYKNPFTAGFLAVQQLSWESKNRSFEIVDRGLANLLSDRKGANLWETLRLLNWVAAPAAQHPAARTPWGSRWIHMMAFGDEKAPISDLDIRDGFGIADDCIPEVIEIRSSCDIENDVLEDWARVLDRSFSPQLPTQNAKDGDAGFISFLLPRLNRRDLVISKDALETYRLNPFEKRRAMNSFLLEQGLILCEPSSKLEGMAGASIGSGNQWISVPLKEVNCNYE